MATKDKQFKKNTAEMFITDTDEAPATPSTDDGMTFSYKVPAGYRLQKEYKSERMQLLVRPLTKKLIKEQAAELGLSMNDLVNNILDEYVERNIK